MAHIGTLKVSMSPPANMNTSITEYNCSRCQDMGVVDIGNNTVGACDCALQKKKQQKIDQLFKSARIPKRYLDKSLHNFNTELQPRPHRIATDYIEKWREYSDKGDSLFFVGDVGTGKSHLAYAILNELIKKGVPGMAVSVPDLMDDLRENGSEGIEALKDIDLLVLDDLGSQKNTEWVTERLFVILNSRYSDLKPTIITSNHRLEVLEKTDGWMRIVDRIIEMCIMVRVEGKSYRQMKRGAANAKD